MHLGDRNHYQRQSKKIVLGLKILDLSYNKIKIGKIEMLLSE